MYYLSIIKIIILIYFLFLVFSIIKHLVSLNKYLGSEVLLKYNNIKYFKKFQKKLRFAGYLLKSEIRLLIAIRYIFPLILFIVVYIMNRPSVIYSFIAISFHSVVFNLFLYKKTSERNRIIEFNGYKIFKFLLNQISSGILVTDSIKSMYLVVNDPKLKSCLIDVSAYYIQTSDIAKALDILKEQYSGIEVDTLCVAIQQGINTGKNCETMRRMEALLFKKYIYHIKRETDAKRHGSFLAVLLLCLIIILMISIPILIDILNAFNQIFI